MKHQRIQLWNTAFEARLTVQVPEIARIIEASGQHAGIAQRDFLAAVGCLHIGHDDEVRREAAGLRIADDEIFLIDPQGQANDFRRQVQKGRIHVAHDHMRLVHQTTDFF